jgi:hypothetical protein
MGWYRAAVENGAERLRRPERRLGLVEAIGHPAAGAVRRTLDGR